MLQYPAPYSMPMYLATLPFSSDFWAKLWLVDTNQGTASPTTDGEGGIRFTLSICKFFSKLCLQLNWHKVKDLDSLVHLLFLYDFLLSCDAI